MLRLADCGPAQSDRVGGKAVGLGELMRLGLPVPDGFVVTTSAYRGSVAAQGAEIVRLTQGLGASTDNREASAAVAESFRRQALAEDIAREIGDAYSALGENEPVAVRSSANAEDTEDASFAGQQDTYLWIVGRDAVLEHVVRCWASLFSPQAIAYRDRVGVSPADIAMAVVVQRMVPAEAAGVMMTLNPVDGDRDCVYIESATG